MRNKIKKTKGIYKVYLIFSHKEEKKEKDI